MVPSRKSVMQALYAFLTDVNTNPKYVQGMAFVGRRALPWDKVPARPALVVADHDEHVKQAGEMVPGATTMAAKLIVYLDAGMDPTATPADALDDVLDAIDAALSPGVLSSKQTLGGLVQHCWVEGDVFKDPGDMDGKGLAIVPVKILVP